jgi:hypothetical protein
VLLLCVALVFANKINSHAVFTIACFLLYLQQTAAHNMVIDKLNDINENLRETHNNCNWIRPRNDHQKSSPPKPTKSYDGDVLTLWNKFAHLFDAKRKTDDVSLSKIYRKLKSEIEDLGQGSIGTSTLELLQTENKSQIQNLKVDSVMDRKREKRV